MDVGTQHIHTVAQRRPVSDVALEWLATVRRVEEMERERPRITSREDALRMLAEEHFAERHDLDPGISGPDADAVHTVLALSVDAARSGDADAILDCIAGWYLTVDQRYRNAVAEGVGGKA